MLLSLLQTFFATVAGNSYKIGCANISNSGPSDDDWLLPTSAQLTFVYCPSGESIIAVLMATRDKPAPNDADSYDFNARDLMPDEFTGDAVLHIHNYLFTKKLMEGLKRNSDFVDADFVITGDSPSALSTTNRFSFHDLELRSFGVTANNGKIHISLSVHKGDVTPGVDVDIDVNGQFTVSAGDGSLQFRPGNVSVQKHINEAWWVTLLGVLVPISAIVTAIIKAIIEDNIPDVGGMISSQISKVNVPVQFSNLNITNFIAKADIGYYGSLELGLNTSFFG